MMHKSCLDVDKHEVDRGVRLSSNGTIEYISYKLANKTGLF